MRSLYRVGIEAYVLGVRLAALRKKKAKQWIEGRKDIQNLLDQKLAKREHHQKLYWFHCASLGEYEQALPLIEQIKEKNPHVLIWVSFFSPSGMNHVKAHEAVVGYSYLPIDRPEKVRLFIEKLRPSIAYFVKYEIWHNVLYQLNQAAIPSYLISATFRPKHIYFKTWGKWFLKSLHYFRHIYVQDQASYSLLQKHGINHVTLSGDTRIDRVLDNLNEASFLPEIEKFLGGRKALVAGSVWAEEVNLITKLLRSAYTDPVLLAPHDISEANIQRMEDQLKTIDFVRLSRWDGQSKHQVLIIDSIGQLKHCYRYGKYALVGGGFGRGLHNILEPAVFGIPIFFGPDTSRFPEAQRLIELHGAFPVKDYHSFHSTLCRFDENPMLFKVVFEVLKKYMEQNQGASARIIDETT